VLQAALLSGRPGLADPIMSALASTPGLDEPGQLQLLVSLVLGLEALATTSAAETGAAAALGDASPPTGAAVACPMLADAAAGSGPEAHAARQALHDAVQATVRHVGGASQEPATPAAAAGAWRALRELAWQREPEARAAAAKWLQQLLATALDGAAEVRARGLTQPLGTAGPCSSYVCLATMCLGV
jgi:hypothetical protein